jgi:hypothetical protein
MYTLINSQTTQGGGVAIGVAPLFIVLDLAASSKPVFMLSTLVSLAVTVLWIGCFGYLYVTVYFCLQED